MMSRVIEVWQKGWKVVREVYLGVQVSIRMMEKLGFEWG